MQQEQQSPRSSGCFVSESLRVRARELQTASSLLFAQLPNSSPDNSTCNREDDAYRRLGEISPTPTTRRLHQLPSMLVLDVLSEQDKAKLLQDLTTELDMLDGRFVGWPTPYTTE